MFRTFRTFLVRSFLVWTYLVDCGLLGRPTFYSPVIKINLSFGVATCKELTQSPNWTLDLRTRTVMRPPLLPRTSGWSWPSDRDRPTSPDFRDEFRRSAAPETRRKERFPWPRACRLGWARSSLPGISWESPLRGPAKGRMDVEPQGTIFSYALRKI